MNDFDLMDFIPASEIVLWLVKEGRTPEAARSMVLSALLRETTDGSYLPAELCYGMEGGFSERDQIDLAETLVEHDDFDTWREFIPSLADAAKPAGRVDTKKNIIRALLAAIAKVDQNLSPEAMPGTRADFFELCQAYDRQAFMTVSLATFLDYLHGICKFRQGAKTTSYYREIAQRIGVKLDNPT